MSDREFENLINDILTLDCVEAVSESAVANRNEALNRMKLPEIKDTLGLLANSADKDFRGFLRAAKGDHPKVDLSKKHLLQLIALVVLALKD